MTATPVSPSLQPPANLRVVSIVGNTVMVAWTAPHGLAATGYVLEGGLSSGEVIASLPVGNTLTFSFTAPTGAYYIRAHALAGSTRSAASNEIRIFVNVPAPPGTPTNLLGLADGTTLTLAWMNSGGGGAATGVILDVSGAIAASLPLPMSEAFTFNGVPPGSYTLSVRATNATGASADSTPVTLTFPGACTAPSTPANFNVSRSGSLITVRWDLPATGSAPTGYLLHVSGTFNGSVPVTTRSLAASAGPGTYTISLAARNSCGTGSATPSQAITVP
jgi:hypothetical protein